MTRILWPVFTIVILRLVGSGLIAQPPDTDSATPLVNAHAHNDYVHPRPLLDALDQGFTSIEADVFLVQDQLLVAHSLADVSEERTLDTLYLQPLQKRVLENQGRVYRDRTTVTLLVDIKTNGKAAWVALQELLAQYDSLISVTNNGVYTEKAVTVIISGDRPVQEIEESQLRRAGIDGRLTDLDGDKPATLMPLISDNWTNHFRYNGVGPMPDAEREKLRGLVTRAHATGRRIRFWATPESPALWQELKAADVDLIGTDDLAKLGRFLRSGP